MGGFASSIELQLVALSIPGAQLDIVHGADVFVCFVDSVALCLSGGKRGVSFRMPPLCQNGSQTARISIIVVNRVWISNIVLGFKLYTEQKHVSTGYSDEILTAAKAHQKRSTKHTAGTHNC